MPRNVIRKIAALARHPKMISEYIGWTMSSIVTGGKPYRKLHGGIEIGDLANFSEYHSIPGAVYEPERRFLEEYPIGAGVIIDVGANVGLVSLLLARRFPDREIHAFEPNPTTFETLGRNCARNGACRVICHRSAVSDADGTVLFDNDPVARANASITYESNEYSAEVPAITLDSFVAANGITAIALLKVDVEGFEALVFRGASRVLREIRPAAIYFEVCPSMTERAGFPSTAAAQILKDAGYELHRPTPNGDLQPAGSDLSGIVVENWLASPV